MDPTALMEFVNKYGWTPVVIIGVFWLARGAIKKAQSGVTLAWGQVWPMVKTVGEKHLETLDKVGASQEAIIEKLSTMDRGKKIDEIHEAALRAKCQYKTESD